MLAAYVWHFWIGVVLVAIAVVASVSLIGGYLKNVSAQRHPGGKSRRQRDL